MKHHTIQFLIKSRSFSTDFTKKDVLNACQSIKETLTKAVLKELIIQIGVVACLLSMVWIAV